MFANSRPVTSRQSAPHPDLEAVLTRHFGHSFQKPISAYNHAAFVRATEVWREWNPRAPLILDAGCGVGWSTARLARAHPDCFVMGVDQSAHRLARARAQPGTLPANLVFIRANLVDFWRELADAGITLSRHYLLYPNPWPKPAHLRRRWHAHPVFPTLLQLGGVLECRSNWKIYIDELALALRYAGCHPDVRSYAPEGEYLTPFERKYSESGQSLWVCRMSGDRRLRTEDG
ncbi:MAG: methyltransferase domain-containing protein [Zoogloeaceae bacterium]|jgi:tRNA (guanine-N7-)-methyltransferase|nr:methyltransferase domain-containing protein [Zoogloeaceae bacterium]